LTAVTASLPQLLSPILISVTCQHGCGAVHFRSRGLDLHLGPVLFYLPFPLFYLSLNVVGLYQLRPLIRQA